MVEATPINRFPVLRKVPIAENFKVKKIYRVVVVKITPLGRASFHRRHPRQNNKQKDGDDPLTD